MFYKTMFYNSKVNSCDGIYNTSLDVRFTKACDNNCSFCIEKGGVDSKAPRPDVPTLIRETKASGKSTVLILGGEPFLYPKELQRYVLGIRFFVKEIYVTTSLPETMLTHPSEVQAILSVIDGLNVSVHHFNSIANNAVLKASSKIDRLGYLEELCRMPSISKKIRVSINLTKDGIGSKALLLKYLQKMHDIGVQHVKIQELQSVPQEDYVNFEDLWGIKLPAPYSMGCQTDISNLFEGLHGLRVTLKRSCLFVAPSLERRISLGELLKYAARLLFPPTACAKVLYEDGELSNGWKSKANNREEVK